MKIDDVKARAFAMPLTSPAFPPGPYRFINREYLIITYRTDPATLEAVVPEPLIFDKPLVKYEFIRMPDSTGFGDYTESGQVIPVKFKGQEGGYSHAMFLNDGPPIYGGRELWGFPKKYAQPSLTVDKDTLIGTLNYGSASSIFIARVPLDQCQGPASDRAPSRLLPAACGSSRPDHSAFARRRRDRLANAHPSSSVRIHSRWIESNRLRACV